MNSTMSVAVLSGKGGVGKTNITLNLAFALFNDGYKSLLMDCDMGLANLDVLLGITPEGNIQDVLLGEASIESVLHSIEPNGLDVLPAASGVPEINDLNPDKRELLVARLAPLLGKYDFVFMDIGAGISDTVQTFAAMATLRIIVITPEPTSLTDSYALIKVLNKRFGLTDFRIVVNEVTSAKEAKSAYEKLAGACKHFLNIDAQFLGYVRMDKKLAEAVCRQRPLMLYAPGSPAAQDIQTMAGKLQSARLNMLDWLARQPILQVIKGGSARE